MRTYKKTVEQKKTETARNPWSHAPWIILGMAKATYFKFCARLGHEKN